MAVVRKRARRRKMAKRKVSAAPRRKVAKRKSRAPRRKAVKRKAGTSMMKQPSVLEVMRGRRKVGALRAKSNVVSWKPRGARRWYNMRADKVAAFFMENGKAAKR